MKLIQGIKNQCGASRKLLISGLSLLLVLALAAISYGPEALGYYRFNESVETAAKDSEANAGPWPPLPEVCMICHGFNGNTVTQIYPRLAGQPAPYLARQLSNFADGQRPNPTMSPLAMTLSADQIKLLSTYFAAQTVAPNAAFTPDPLRRKKGELLVKSANCASCHAAGMTGQGEFPRLAGQGYDYLVEQLNNFKNGSRKDANGVMAAIAAPLSVEEIENMAHYLASY